VTGKRPLGSKKKTELTLALSPIFVRFHTDIADLTTYKRNDCVDSARLGGARHRLGYGAANSGGRGAPSQMSSDDIANRILLSLPQASLKRLRPALEFCAIAAGEVISRLGQPIEYRHFVNRGVISLVKTMKDGRTVEIGVVGAEGISNPCSIFGINTAIFENVVQIPGTTFRIKQDDLNELILQDDALAEAIEKYQRFFISAIGQTAACNRLHHLEERCCRWLLIAHDSARSDTFLLTHEFLAMMLGVQRAGVSIAAQSLQKAGLIQYRRGQVAIVNRTGLEEAACECYRAMQIEFDKLFKPRRKS
jgi:CRP-like cAMP-binding protein